jgi:hypothetical protein
MSFAVNKNNFIDLMTNIDTVRCAGALAGFSWSYGTPRSLVEYPLSSVFQGALGAAMTVFWAEFVDGFLPKNFRPVLIGALFASTVYHINRSRTENNCPPRYV